MGGDFFPDAPIDGVLQILNQKGNSLIPVLIGDSMLISGALEKRGLNPSDFEIAHTSQVIEMGESPARAIATKPDCSINVGMRLVKEKNIAAFVSAGNTGAILVASSLSLGNLPGVSRAAIGVLMPNLRGNAALLLDIGANIDAKPEYLAQFGMLGSVFMRSMMKIENPKVALLNVGEEKGKGTAAVKEAYSLLENNPLIQFSGNAEGRDLLIANADVFVCDGFTGNIVLKFGESIYEELKGHYQNDSFIESFNFENYGGVPVLGINGIVMIGHGISGEKAIANMIRRAGEAAENELNTKIKDFFASMPSPQA